jgi:hypothetical protein
MKSPTLPLANVASTTVSFVVPTVSWTTRVSARRRDPAFDDPIERCAGRRVWKRSQPILAATAA